MLLRALIFTLLTVAPALLQGCMTWETTRTSAVEEVVIGAPTNALGIGSATRKGEALELVLQRVATGRMREITHNVDETEFSIESTVTGRLAREENEFLFVILCFPSLAMDGISFLLTAPWVFPAGAIQGIDPDDEVRELPYRKPSAVPPGTEIVLASVTPGVAVTLTAVHGEQVLFPITEIAIPALRSGIGAVELEVYEKARPDLREKVGLKPETQLDALDAWFTSAGPPEQRLEAWREAYALVPATATALRDSVYRRVQLAAEEVRILVAQRDAKRKAYEEQARLAAERSLQEEQKRLALARKEEQEARRQEEESKRARLAAEETARVEEERRRIAREEAEIQKIMEADRRAEVVERLRLSRLSAEERRREQEATRSGAASAPSRTSGALSVDTPAPAATPQGEGRTFVLAIGINKYADASITPLRFAENDAKEIYKFYATADWSTTDPDRVTKLVGADATREGILRAIREKLEQRAVNANDTAILFFAGHGYATAHATYIAPVDTKYGLIAETAISSSQLQEAWGRVRAGRKVMLVDACRSGGLEGQRGIGGVTQAPELAKGQAQVAFAGGRSVLIAAAGESELSTENADLEQGCFTMGLLNGLRGAADRDGDGRVTDQELGKFLTAEVPALAARVGGKQTPEVTSAGNVGVAILSRAPKR